MKKSSAIYRHSETSEFPAFEGNAAADVPAEASFQTLAGGSMQGIVVVAQDVWNFLFVNDAYVRMLGFETAAEIFALGSLESMIDADDLDGLKSQEWIPSRGGAPCYRSYRVKRKNGSGILISDMVTPISWRGETAWLATSLSISGTKNIREAPCQTEIHVDDILNNVADSVVTIDKVGIILSFNRAAERTFGYMAAEVIGRNISLLTPESLKSSHQGYIDAYINTGKSGIIGC